MHRSVDVTIINPTMKELPDSINIYHLFLSLQKEEKDSPWCLQIKRFGSVASSLNLCLSLCLVPLWHTRSTSHTPLLTHAALLVCRSVLSMSQIHTCSKHTHDGFLPHKSTCERHMLHTRPESAMKFVSHTCSRSILTHRHKEITASFCYL